MVDLTIFTQSDLDNDDELADESYLTILDQEGFISVGASHLLASDPKAGKTELLFQSAQSWQGYRVLWMTEESRRMWRRRLKRRSSHIGKVPHITWDYATGKVLVDRSYAIKRILDDSYDVIIIDTVRSLLSLTDENDNSAVAAAIVPYIQAAVSSSKTLILVHHERKVAGQFGQGISGASAFGGIVDTLLELKRMPGFPDSTARKLEILGRVDIVGEITYFRMPSEEFKVMSGPGVPTLEVRLAVELDGWKTTAEIVTLLSDPKPSAEHIRKTLLGMAYKNDVERDPPVSEQSRGKTVKWRKI